MTEHIIINNIKGSVQFTDTQYTTSSRLVIPSGVRTVLPNNKGGVLVLQEDGSNVSTWVTENTITPKDGDGTFYLARITLTVDSILNNRNLTIDLDIGGAQGIIWEKTERLARGAGFDTKVSIAIPYYTLDTFFANGGTINVTVDGDVEVYNISFLIKEL